MELLSTSYIEVRNTKQQRNDLRQYRGTIYISTHGKFTRPWKFTITHTNFFFFVELVFVIAVCNFARS